MRNNALKIGNIELCSRAVFAPMAGYTDLVARYLARLYGAGLTTSEMVSAKGLIYDNKETKKLLDKTEIETPFRRNCLRMNLKFFIRRWGCFRTALIS